MKKLISVILAALMLCTMFVLPSFAAGTVKENETKRLRWSTMLKMEESFVLTPGVTGYYTINLSASLSSGKLNKEDLSILIQDKAESDEAKAYESYYIGGDKLGSANEYKNIYLLKGHSYNVDCSYLPDVNTIITVDITFKPSSYAPAELSSSALSKKLETNSIEWFEFTPEKTGDYYFSTKGIENCRFEIFDNSDILFVDYYCYDGNGFKVRLDAEKKYTASLWIEEGTKASNVTLSVKKCAKDIKKIQINKELKKNWIGWMAEENYNYKVTYTDGTSEILSFKDTKDLNLYIEYKGTFSDKEFESVYNKGTQKIKINYLYRCTDDDAITIHGALEMVEGKTAIKENQAKAVTLKKTQTELFGEVYTNYEYEGFYKIKVTQTNVYDISLGKYDDDCMAFFDIYEDNKEVQRDDESNGYILKAGKEYCLQAEFSSMSYEKVGFKLVASPDHQHTFSKAKLASAATTKADGKKTETCKVCGYVKTTKINKIASVKLSATKYAYDGKAKTPSVTVKDSAGKTLKKGTDYTVTYSKNKAIGKAYAKITFKGNYKGTKTISFSIVPAKVRDFKAAAKSAKSIKLSWSSVKGATGYKVYKYNSKTKKYTEIASTKGTTTTIKNLKAGTGYKFYIKAYTKVGDKNYMSAGYTKLSVTTKK